MDIVMEPNVKEEDAVVVTGYTTQRKSDLTGSIEVVNTASTKDLSSGSTLQNIWWKGPGLYITSDGSLQRCSPVNIDPRVNTLGNTTKLYIVDECRQLILIFFSSWIPIRLSRCRCCADASASSIYGSRASNGVIIVNNKTGNNVSVTVNSSISAASYNRPLFL